MREITVEGVGLVKVASGELRVYRDGKLIASVVLDNAIRAQLIAELAAELRYGPD